MGGHVAHETPLAHRGLGAESEPERGIGHARGGDVPEACHRGEWDPRVRIPQLPLVDLGLAQQHLASQAELSEPLQLDQHQAHEPRGFLHSGASLPVEYLTMSPGGRAARGLATLDS